jgi:y4mF family transcriptional regulator
MNIAKIVKEQRKLKKLSQVELAIKCGVGLRFIRELEQGKKTLRLDKVNQVLHYLGYEAGAIKLEQVIQ